MKKLMMAGLMLVATTVLFTACKKSDNNSNNAGVNAKVNGTQFTSSANAASALKSTAAGSLFITGGVVSGSTATSAIELYVYNFNGATGTFTFDSSSTTIASAVYIENATSTHIAKSGQIVITSISTSNVQGTFNFVTGDGFTITNGTFNTSLVTQ